MELLANMLNAEKCYYHGWKYDNRPEVDEDQTPSAPSGLSESDTTREDNEKVIHNNLNLLDCLMEFRFYATSGEDDFKSCST